jgi:hypothetical protein
MESLKTSARAMYELPVPTGLHVNSTTPFGWFDLLFYQIASDIWLTKKILEVRLVYKLFKFY